jgi:hypothetical protein
MRPEGALEQDSERGRSVCDDPGFERDVWRGTHAAYEQPFRSPLQGESLLEGDPGLKPWAILLCHFVAFGRIAFAAFAAFAASPHRRIAASPHRRIAVSPYRRIAVSPYRRIAVSPYRRIAVSPYRRIAVSPTRIALTSPSRPAAVSAVRRYSRQFRRFDSLVSGCRHALLRFGGLEPDRFRNHWTWS